MSIHVREIDESLFEEEIYLCIPPKDSPEHSSFKLGIEKKRDWLKKRLNELGSVGQIAYWVNQPIAFIEHISAEKAPIPVEENGKTALITCIYKPKSTEKGVGTMLVKAALERLQQLEIRHVKTLVSRFPQWITGGIYFKSGFQHEKTFYKPGSADALDLLTLNLKGTQDVKQPTSVKFALPVKDSLPIEIVCFSSGQCPFNALILTKLLQALRKFDSSQVVLKVMDSWENWKLAREWGVMYMGFFINGKTPFLGPPTQEKIEEEIRKEIERTTHD